MCWFRSYKRKHWFHNSLTWWNSRPIMRKNMWSVSTTTNWKGIFNSGGCLQPLQPSVVDLFDSLSQSTSSLSIGHSSTKTGNHKSELFVWTHCTYAHICILLMILGSFCLVANNHFHLICSLYWLNSFFCLACSQTTSLYILLETFAFFLSLLVIYICICYTLVSIEQLLDETSVISWIIKTEVCVICGS